MSTQNLYFYSRTWHFTTHMLLLSERNGALKWQIRILYFGQRLSCIGRGTWLPATSRRILPAAHTLKSGLSSTDKKVRYVPGEISHCFQVLSWNLTYLFMGSILANDKDIANHNGKIFRQKAAIRPQNIGLKATAAKRPHFAHGRPRQCG